MNLQIGYFPIKAGGNYFRDVNWQLSDIAYNMTGLFFHIPYWQKVMGLKVVSLIEISRGADCKQAGFLNLQ